MSDGKIKWIKLSVDLFSDEKIKQIRSMPDGNSVLVVWLQLLCLAGRKNHCGFITLTEEIAYTEEMLATEFEMPIKTVMMALELFQRFGMVDIIDDIYHISNWDKHQSLDGMDKIREKDRVRKAEARQRAKQGFISAESKKALPAPEKEVPPDMIAATIPLNDGTNFIVTMTDADKYSTLYPAVDVAQELRKMIGWCEANPRNRKTRRGVAKFINGWLSRAQDRAPTARPVATATVARPGLEDWDG